MVDVILPRAIGQSATVQVGTVEEGFPLSITNSGTDSAVILDFVIPNQGGVVPPFPISYTTGLQDALDAKQPLDADLTAIAALTTTTFGRNALTYADAAAARTAQGLVIGTDVQAYDADLSSLASASGTNTIYYRSGASTWSPVTIGTNLTFSGGTLSATGGGGGGSGDVTGPASSTDNAVALYNGTTGKILKDGPLLSTYALLASPAFTGTPTAPTASAGTSTTQLATTAFVTTADNLKANLASPTFTGTPAAPTAAQGTNTTQLATTAFVQTEGALKANLSDTINAQTGTTYTLVAGDNGKVIELNNASAITLTCPVLTTGFNVLIRQTGAGQVTVATSSTTLRNRQSQTKLAGQWAEASIAYRATNEFVLSGDTTT